MVAYGRRIGWLRVVASLLLLVALSLPSPGAVNAQQGSGALGTFPAEPFNGLQVQYQINGALVSNPKDSAGFTMARAVTGTLAPQLYANMLTVSGTASWKSGWSADLEVTAWVDGVQGTPFKVSHASPWSETFKVQVPMPANARSAGFRIDLTGSYNAGSRSVVITGDFTGAGSGTGTGTGTTPGTGTGTPPTGTTPPTGITPLPPAPTGQTGGAQIWTDKAQYAVGETLTYCYRLPGPAYVTITDVMPDGTSQVVLQGMDDGTGDCRTGTITPPGGVERLVLQGVTSAGQTLAAETSFTVAGGTSGTPGGCAWTGTWSTSWGSMTMTQVGDTVTGAYEHDQGRIVGTVRGNVLTGTWSESPSYAPPGDAGDVELTMGADCASFTGRWRYDSTGGWSTDWSGKRVGAAVPVAPVVPPATTATNPVFGAIRFGRDVNQAGPSLIGETTSFPAGTTEIYAMWTYRGMRNGLDWGRVWLRDGQIALDKRTGNTWDDGPEGTTWLHYYNNDGLRSGSYQFVLYVEGKEIQRGGFTIR